MDIRKLQRAIVDGLEDVKAQDIVVFNTEHLSPLFERVIIASGTSNRQTKALAASVRDAVKRTGMPVLSTEGGENGEWIIVDCGAAVAHVMQPNIRDYYRLEEIWGGKPIKMKLGDVAKGLPKAESADDDDEPPVAKAAAKKASATQTPAKKVVAKKAGAYKAPAKKVARSAPAGTVAPRKSAVAKPSANKPVVSAKKTARPAAPAKRAAPARPVQKVVVGKPAPAKSARGAAKRPAARKTASRG